MTKDKNLRDLLRGVTHQNVLTSKICVVRRNSITADGQQIDLLYDCEPLDSVGYSDKNAYNISGDTLTQNMTDVELELSKQNWLYDVRLTAQPNIDTYKLSEDTSTGIFQQPEINSFVIVSFLNNTDAFISLISQAGNIKIKGAGGQEVDLAIDDFVEVNEKLMRFTGSDVFQMLNTRGVEFLMREIILLKNKDNFIEVGETDIKIRGFNANASIFSITVNSNVMIGGEAQLTAADKFLIKNNTSDMRDDILLKLEATLKNITDALTKINAVTPGNPGIADIALAITNTELYSISVKSLFF